jgi:transglutaminase-like putative cysteine protease
MRLSIVHETEYRYQNPAHYTIQYLRLSPQSSRSQKVLSWQLELPAPARPFLDGFGNSAHVLVIDRPHQEIRIRARGEVEVEDDPVTLPDPGPHRPDLYMRNTELTTQDEALVRFSEKFRREVTNNREAAIESLMLGVREKVDYQPGVTHSATSAAQAFARGAGVCQDHAHVFVACCRQLQIPARYVSGYLAPQKITADKETGAQAMASHAWAEAWIDGLGWQGFDVANRVRAHGRHVRLAVGLDYLDACPVRGFRRGGSGESMGVEVQVNETLYREVGQGTKPTIEEQQAQQQQQ